MFTTMLTVARTGLRRRTQLTKRLISTSMKTPPEKQNVGLLSSSCSQEVVTHWFFEPPYTRVIGAEKVVENLITVI
jgi:hypothetical protein